MIKIKVPATTANIGPGFDCLGMAFNIYNEYYVEKSKDFFIDTDVEEFATKKNLFNVAFTKTMELLKKSGSFHLRYNYNVPISRGLGSSANIIVAGCMAANILYGNNKLSSNDIFQIATKIEGHPDNVAPAIFHGLTAATKLKNGAYHYKKWKVSNKFNFYVLIPDFKTSTEMARKLLPTTYKRSEAVQNISNAIFTCVSLASGDFETLKSTSIDYIHEPYRMKLIKDYKSIKKIVEELNSILLISGSGPTLLVISLRDNIETMLMNKLSKNTSANWDVKKVRVI